MARDTTVQFRIDSAIKEEAFAVFHEMGLSPSEAVRVFFKQVQKTRTIPFVVGADAQSSGEVEDGYTVWLKTRLADTIKQLDSGTMASYPSAEARKLLKKRLAERRGDRATQSKKSR
jgi:addiction module RelB/DinJ family antitoxin